MNDMEVKSERRKTEEDKSEKLTPCLPPSLMDSESKWVGGSCITHRTVWV